jgi:hypothetical protein
LENEVPQMPIYSQKLLLRSNCEQIVNKNFRRYLKNYFFLLFIFFNNAINMVFNERNKPNQKLYQGVIYMLKRFNKGDKRMISDLLRMKMDDSLRVVKIMNLYGYKVATLISINDYYFDRDDDYNLDFSNSEYEIYDTHKEAFEQYQKYRFGKILIKFES